MKMDREETICIVGMGRSGEAAARLALRQGCRVRLLEQKDSAAVKEKAQILRVLGMDVLLGEHRPDMLEGVQRVVISPGVRADSEIFAWAQRRGIEALGEMEWSSRQFDGKVVAVTGTNGKTTTTALAAHLLNENGLSAAACGNIGTPLAQVILSGQVPQVAVAEVSSFQLETIRSFHPAISLFLNFTPDHLDRYADLEEYWQAKLRVFDNQGPGDWAVFHSDLQERLEPLLRSKGIRSVAFGWDPDKADILVSGQDVVWKEHGILFQRQDVPLLGNHNLENACAAAAAALLCGLESGAIAKAMRTFRAVDHRLQPVGQIGQVRFINDSKATNVDSLAVALKSFSEKVVLIAGGKHKNQDFSPLRTWIHQSVKTLVLIGEGAGRMTSQWEGAAEIIHAQTMQEAVEKAWQKAQPAGVVLLSPACASFDMFNDYEHRGREFVRCVAGLEEMKVAEV